MMTPKITNEIHMTTARHSGMVRQYATQLLSGLAMVAALLVLCLTTYVQLGAQNQGAPAPVQPLTFFDANGDPLNTGTVSTYVSGGSTSAVTYSDQALNTRNANPVALDSAGRGAIFLSATQIYRFVVADSSNAIQFTQDGIAGANYIAEQQALDITPCDGRLSGQSSVPVPTTSVTDVTTLYYTPYVGNRCAVYDGTDWRHYTFSELSLSLGTDAANTNYDVFIYATNGSTLALERTAWTNQFDRTTNLTRQHGILVRTGAATRRYLGTYRTTATIGETEDSVERRLIWNFYHRVPRLMRVLDDSASWSSPVNVYAQARGLSSNLLSFVSGDTSLVQATVRGHGSNGAAGGGFLYLAIGDGTSKTPISPSFVSTNYGTGLTSSYTASAEAYARVGFHTWVWMERASTVGSNTAVWRGTDGDATLMQSGIWGVIDGD